MKAFPAQRSWAPPHINLLLRANLAEPGEARAAWQAWQRMRVFEDAEWPEVRLLAPLSRRIAGLDPDTALRPRLEGMAKAHWTHTQLILLEFLPALDTLNKAGIQCLIFKGGAYYAEGLAPATRRLMGDVDILVRPNEVSRASDALCDAGWASSSGESPECLRQDVLIRTSTNYRKGRFGDIDLHRQVFHFSRRSAELDAALWRDARLVEFGGKKVLVPSPEDSIVISLSHGIVCGDGDWAIDVGHRISTTDIDWDRVVEIVERRGLVSAALAGLTYLRSLGLAVPHTTMARLHASDVPIGEWLKHWSNLRRGVQRRGVIGKVMNRVADVMLPQQYYDYRIKGNDGVPVRRSNLGLRLGGRPIELAGSARRWKRRHELGMVTETGQNRLAVALCIRAPKISRRVFFDVCAGGTAIARLRSRSGGGKRNTEHTLHFRFPLPPGVAGPVAVTIESRPIGYVDETSDAEAHHAKEALPFRVLGAWAL